MDLLYSQPRSTFGKPISIDPRYPVLADATLEPKVDAVINPGQAVTVDQNGKVIPVTDNVPVYGLSKISKNQYEDETRSINISGSGKITVIVNGIVDLMPVSYTQSDGSQIDYIPFDTSVAWKPMDPVAVDLASGKLTNAVTDETNEKTVLGYVVAYDNTDPNFPVLRIRVNR